MKSRLPLPVVVLSALALSARARAAALPSINDLAGGFFGGDAAIESTSVPPVRARKPRPAPSPSQPSRGGGSLPSFIFTGRGADVSEDVAAAIDSAQSSVHAALYTLTLPNVADALVRARGRGLDVRVIYDYGHSQSGKDAGGSQPMAEAASAEKIGQLVSGGVDVRVLRGTGAYGIMHNKFAVIDGGRLETGSFNWTTAADTKNHENALFREDAGLAADYAAYFDWMWAQAGPVGETPGKPSGQPPSCADGPTALGRAWPQCSFSPNGPTEQLLAEAISRAQSRVHIAMFSFTSPAIISALADAKNRGVDVLMVLDRSQSRTESATLTKLRSAGVPFRIDAGLGGSGGVLHDKFGVFDDLLETGSFNYTTNASKNNFENAYFTADPSFVDGYEAEFQKIYAEGADQ